MNANNLEIDLSNAGIEQLLENPKAQNKKESKPKSNLNLSNKKHSLKSNISHPNLEKMEKTYRYRFQRSDGGKYIA